MISTPKCVLLPALVAWAGALAACSSAPTSLPGLEAGEAPPGPPPSFDATPAGWAAVADLGLTGTSGGEGGEVVEVSTTSDFKVQAENPGPRVILISGVIGDGQRISIASNITVIGLPGAEYHGGLRVDGAFNVIIRNLTIVGNNCADVDPPAEGEAVDCSRGADTVSIGDGAHHVWVDHCDISNGSDGNLDINDQADYITISWTKFHYHGLRPGAHRYSNLIGSSDENSEDAGRLRVTWHHNWWAENVDERMPRVRYGAVHLFNNLYTSAGNSYCIRVGAFANVLTERNYFYHVNDPIETDESNAASIVVSRDNVYDSTTGTVEDKGEDVFTPPYPYVLDDAATIKTTVQNGAGVCHPAHVFSATPVPSCSAAE